MSAIFLLAGVVSLVLVLRGHVRIAFLWVYLPCLLLLPHGYAYRLPHLPPLSAAQAALIPIGVVSLIRRVSKRSFSFMDLLVTLFIVSLTLSEVLREPVLNDGIFTAVLYFISIFLAYMTGRELIEPDLRIATVKRIVILMLLLAPAGLVEFRLAFNPYGMIGERIFHIFEVPVGVQMRSGHGRMGGSFTDAEIGGIAFGMAAALNAWLVFLSKRTSTVSVGRLFAVLEKWHLPGLCLLLFVFLTQSRGPMLSVLVAYMVLQIPRFKNVKLASIVAGCIIFVGAVGAYVYFHRYTNIDPRAVVSEQQGSALYRRRMNAFYQPIAEQGGWLGWGLLQHPTIPGLESTDNEFLLVHLSQGKLGYFLFILISLESVRRLCVNSWRFETREDKAFAFSMIGAMMVFWITLLTVYMGEQLPQVGFLLIGWGQSLVPGAFVDFRTGDAASEPKFAFKRVHV